jgi:predicted transcriptional regulator
MRPRRLERNREIFAAFRAGKTVSQLAESYGLARMTVASLLNIEKYKLEVSSDEYYRDLRRSMQLRPEVEPLN